MTFYYFLLQVFMFWHHYEFSLLSIVNIDRYNHFILQSLYNLLYFYVIGIIFVIVFIQIF